MSNSNDNSGTKNTKTMTTEKNKEIDLRKESDTFLSFSESFWSFKIIANNSSFHKTMRYLLTYSLISPLASS